MLRKLDADNKQVINIMNENILWLHILSSQWHNVLRWVWNRRIIIKPFSFTVTLPLPVFAACTRVKENTIILLFRTHATSSMCFPRHAFVGISPFCVQTSCSEHLWGLSLPNFFLWFRTLLITQLWRYIYLVSCSYYEEFTCSWDNR